MEKIEMTFGYLPISTSVEERLEQLGYDKESLEDAIKEHGKNSGSNMPALYVGTYAKYNMGSLRGLWIDLSTFDTYEDFMNFCYAIHADEDDPELMFQDYECFPHGWYAESCFKKDGFNKIKKFIELCDEYPQEVVETYIDKTEGEIDDFEDRYMGEFNSEKDFAEYYCEEYLHLDFLLEQFAEYYSDNKFLSEQIQNLSCRIDYDGYARDLFIQGFTFCNGYVFADS